MRDSGFRVVLSSGAPKKTFIASYGAEAHGDSDTFDTLEPQPKDVVHISGNTLMDHTATGVDGLCSRPVPTRLHATTRW